MIDFCSIDEASEFLAICEISKAQRKGFSDFDISDYPKLMSEAKSQAGDRKEDIDRDLKNTEEQLRRMEEELFYKALDKIMSEGDGKEQDIAKMIASDGNRNQIKGEISFLERKLREITNEDIEKIFDKYEGLGYIDRTEGVLKITSLGSKILGGGFLGKIMENLSKKGIGTHKINEIGYGADVSKFSRKYEFGDPYGKINIQKTLINTMERTGGLCDLTIEDFEVHESLYQAKMNTGIMIDVSGSMKYGRKMDAAIETALALCELIRTGYPEDMIRIFTFSEQVKEIQFWEVANIGSPAGWTDIRAAMKSFRTSVTIEDGDKQAYLITDTEPNYENGGHVGFSNAMAGVLEESIRYGDDEITLNVIMLDGKPNLVKFARLLAERNFGRAFFTKPQNLGEAIIEDYITSRRERVGGGYRF